MTLSIFANIFNNALGRHSVNFNGHHGFAAFTGRDKRKLPMLTLAYFPALNLLRQQSSRAYPYAKPGWCCILR